MALTPFKGSAEHEKAWNAFCAHELLKQGALAEPGLNYLNELLDENLTAKEFLARHNDVELSKLRDQLDTVCGHQSLLGIANNSQKKLNHHIVTRLVNRWSAFLLEHNMQPSEENNPRSAIVRERRGALRALPEGELLSWAIISACRGVRKGAEARVKDRMDSHDLASYSMDITANTLFSFDDSKGNEGKTIGERFCNYLFGRIIVISKNKSALELKEKEGVLSFDRQASHGDERDLYAKLADERAVDPSQSAEKHEMIGKMLLLVDRLNPKEQRVIRERFGLNEEHRPRTLKEIGELMGRTRERVRQLEERAISKLRRWAEQQEAREAHPTGDLGAGVMGRMKRLGGAVKKRLSGGMGESEYQPLASSLLADKGWTSTLALVPVPQPPQAEEVIAPMPPYIPEKMSAQEMELRACFVSQSPRINLRAGGRERVRAVSQFVRYLRAARNIEDMGQLAEHIAHGRPDINPEILRESLVAMTAKETGKPISIREDPAEAQVYARAVADFAFPGEGDGTLHARCVDFLASSTPGYARQAEPSPEAEEQLRAYFSDSRPRLNLEAKGAERAIEMGKFFRTLRQARGCSDMAELAAGIANNAPGIVAESLRGALVRLRVPDEELDAPTAKTHSRHYRATLVNDNEGGVNYAKAVADFAFPNPDDAALNARCMDYLSSKRFWTRKVKTTEDKPQPVEVPAVKLGFRQTTVNTTDPVSLDKAQQLVQEAREAYGAMQEFDREKADAIARSLFKKLIEGYSISRVSALSAGEINGESRKLNSGTLSRWMNGRKEKGVTIPGKVDVDTVAGIADALCHSVFPNTQEGRVLAKAMANYLSGVPWEESRDNAQLLAYAKQAGLDTGSYMHLARRQLRMAQHEYEKYLQVPHERYSEMVAPADRKYAERVNLGDFEAFVDRQGFATPEEKADFRRMVLRKPKADYGEQLAKLTALCKDAESGSQPVTLRDIVRQAFEVHGLRSPDDMAVAIFHHEQLAGTNPEPHMQAQLERDLRVLINDDKDVQVSRPIARMILNYSLPAIEHAPLRGRLVDTFSAHVKQVTDRAELSAQLVGTVKPGAF
ncbi:MAG: sigma-70 family RNA polymerase sigma factor [Proteobacteria bacterium]|nr:sigma-70 family RNA polymerase sigma factor [Pseudomonadota bacterium]